MTNKQISELVMFLRYVGKPVFDNGKRVYYLDYNGKGRKIAWDNELDKALHQ